MNTVLNFRFDWTDRSRDASGAFVVVPVFVSVLVGPDDSDLDADLLAFALAVARRPDGLVTDFHLVDAVA